MSLFIEDAYVKLIVDWGYNDAGSVLRGSIGHTALGRHFIWDQGLEVSPDSKFPVVYEFANVFDHSTVRHRLWRQLSPLELLALQA